ncbi:circularly permuted type 2 ATP-grasp protein [Pseudoclavibacter chungangensis]|uniref:Circularly permuted type 2 ATP-grasp protein n=1 Tax=Pseudoclavibacter chungangensis TaxID=587635 RepID=A0A7J5C032_9MICO|nr:circularly permuted type 2 ATP-grasp protein [Pseudoclavibacter chungangensis]KAB1660126.1 circularly permuted type 2 ATP-grasp protein [Pseudoclavibacter chungangensis]NYJ66767.1 putative circularly permuted ATP-grasp superfamily protein/putative alpha-E superfamily protein [Pseudoclavibacter chungangensis]
MTFGSHSVGTDDDGPLERGFREVLEGRDRSVAPDDLVAALVGGDPLGMLEAKRAARRLVQDDGITYGGTADGGQARLWEIDPIPVVIGAAEWASLERGLEQRARALHALQDDLYGERRLLRDGVVPPPVVLGHPGFVRPAVGVPRERRPLVMFATDLGRDADGSWRVLGDRTQAPSGAGYAMATRRVVARLLPRLHRTTEIGTLLGFFHTMSAALTDAAPSGEGTVRTVMLSPGAASETAFDQAFLASALGVPLVEADDLVVRDGRPWLRAGHGDVPVDVVLRRVDELWSDPLDLRGESELGVPGLLESTRLGNVTVVNPIGAGVLESVGLAPYLGDVVRRLLGEEPLLESPETWWCGDATARSHVLANFDTLLIRPTDRADGPTSIAGWELDRTRREHLRDEILARPWAWTGQRPLPLSSTPTVTADGLEDRRFVLRTFGAWHGERFELMRGGLGRVAAERDEHTVSNERGALAKDVWVLGTAHGSPADTVVTTRRTRARRRGGLFETTPRVADNLHWVGRYTERADGTVRLLAVAGDLAEDHALHPGTAGNTALGTLLAALPGVTGARPRADGEAVADYLRDLVVGPAPRGTIASSVARVVRASQQVRDLLSDDTWSELSALERAVGETHPLVADELRPHFDSLLGPLLALQGIAAHGMYRDETWAYLDAGVRIERAQFAVALLMSVLTPASSPVVEFLVTEAVLRVFDSVISHRRRVADATGPAVQVESTLDLLLVDRRNPRSVAFQLEALERDLRIIGDATLVAAVRELIDGLPPLDLGTLTDDRDALESVLVSLLGALRTIGDRIERRHFLRQAPHAAHQARWSPERRART